MGLKDVVVQRLQQYFGDYVDGLTPENLRVQVLAGTITQSDLSLKAEALAQLQLPVIVRAGRLRRFHVEVPWSRITSEPVVVHIAGVTVLAALAEENDEDAAAAAELASVQLASLLQKKIEAVNAAEALRKAGLELAAEGEEDSYAARLGRTILNNLRVNISDLHIRFEDVPPAGLGHPVCLGVQLVDLRIVTTDANGKELFMDDEERGQNVKDHESREGPPIRHKALTVSDLAVYLTQPAENDILLNRLKGRDVRQLGDAFEKLPAFEPHGREYILQPTSGRVDVALGTAPWQPQASVRSRLNGISVALSSAQYEDATAILRRLAETTVRTESRRSLARPHFRGYRPTVGASPRAWWVYLIAAHRDTRSYISLYTLVLLGKAQLSTIELTELRMLEHRLEVWQIMRCRAIAEAAAGMESHTEDEYLNSEAMCAPRLETVQLPVDYCSVDVELTVTGMCVALSLTNASNNSSSRTDAPKDNLGRRKRRHAAQGLIRDDLVQLKLDITYCLRVLPKHGVKEYRASIDSLTVVDRRLATAGVYTRVFTPLATRSARLDLSEHDEKLERFYGHVSRHPNKETVAMLAAATANTEEEVAEWFAAKNAEHLATISVSARPSEYDIEVKIDSPFSVVYSPSLLHALKKVFAATAPIALVDEATASLRRTREAMSAAISVANVAWKFKASIASFLFLLPQDVTDAASMVLAVDLGSFGMEASRGSTQENTAQSAVMMQLGEAWSDVRFTEGYTFDVHAQIELTDTQAFISKEAIADWGDVLETRTADSRRLMAPVSLKLLMDGSPDRLVAALDCTTGVEVSTTPEQLNGLLLMQQHFFTESDDAPDSTTSEETASGHPMRSPQRLALLAAVTCPHVSWSVISGDSCEPVLTASMRRLVLCSAAFPAEERFRGLFRLNSISMHAGVSVLEPAEMDVKLQQLTLTWHPEVINEIRTLYETFLRADDWSIRQAMETRGTGTAAHRSITKRGLRVKADLTVLRFDLAIDSAVKYCAKVLGAHACAEFRVDSCDRIHGEVQTLQIEDYAVVSKWRRFIGIADGHDDSLIEFTYRSEDNESHLDLAVQSPMQFIYHPGLAQDFIEHLSDLMISIQQMICTLAGAKRSAQPQTLRALTISLKLCAPNVVYALSSSSSKSFSFDLCDLRLDHIRSRDGTAPVTTVRMVEPNATIRGSMFSDFCGIMAETLSVQCYVQMFTLNACANDVHVNGLASTTISMLNQREGAWQVLCSVPSTVVNVERECDVWNFSCEAAENEHISVNVRDAFLNTLAQSFTSVDGASCTIKNRSGVAVLFAVNSVEQKLEHGAQCPLFTNNPVIDRGSLSKPLLSVRPVFETDCEVPSVKLPLTETAEFIRDFTTSNGETISIMIATELVDGALHVTCRSLIEVENTGAVAVDVHVSRRGKLALVGTAMQDGQRVSVVKYNESAELRLALQGGVRTSSPFVVGGVSTSSQTVVLPGENGRAPQYFQVDVSPSGALFLVRVSAAFCVENLLPFDASFSVIDGSSKSVLSRQELVRARSGARADLYSCGSYNCSTLLLHIVPAEESGYISGAVMLKKREASSVDDAALMSNARFVHADGSVLTLLVAWSSDRVVDVYTKFWLHNLTGLRLRAREDMQSDSVQPTVRNSDGRWVISGDEGEGIFGSVCGIELSRASKEVFLSVESSERAVINMEELAELDFCLREKLRSGRGSRSDLPIPDRFWNVHCIVDMAPYPFQRTRLLTVRPSVAISNCTGETLLFSTRDDVEPLKVSSDKVDCVVPVHQFSTAIYSVRIAEENCEVGDPSVWSDPVLLNDDRHMIVHKPDSSPWFQITVVSGRTEAAKVLECKKIATRPATEDEQVGSAGNENNKYLSLVQISVPGVDVYFADFDRFGDSIPFSLQDECLELHLGQASLFRTLTDATVEWSLSLASVELVDLQRDLVLFRSQQKLRQQKQTFLSTNLVLGRNATLTNIRHLAVNLYGQSKLTLNDVAIMATVELTKRFAGHFREESLLSGVEVMRLLRTPLSRTDETKTIFVQTLQLSEHQLSVEFARVSNLEPKRFGGLKRGFQAKLTVLLNEAELYEVLGTAESIQNRLLQTYRDSLRRQIFGQIFRIVSSNVSLGREALLVGKAVARIGGATSKGLRNMGFVTQDLPTSAAIVSKHFRRFHECQSIAEFERQLWHMLYDWDSNHTTVNASKCVCIGVLNKSASTIRVLDVQLKSGHSCEILRREVSPKSSTTDSWQIGSSTVLFASGESPMGLQKVVDSVGSIECIVRTTAGAFHFTHMGATFVPNSGKTATFLQQDIHTWYSRHLVAVADVDETTRQEHEPTTAHAIVWQNQRRIAVFGLGGEWSAESLGVIPGDPPPFSDSNGQIRYSGTSDHRLLPRGGEWASGSKWVPGRWQHSIGFQEVLGGWSETEGMTDSVRRRCWTRLYALSTTDTPHAVAAAAAAVAAATDPSDARNGKVQESPRRTPSPKQVGTLVTTMRSASRATLVFVDNRTSDPLQLVHMDVVQGTWADPPPERVQPNEKVVFGLQSIGWAGCEARITFLCGSIEMTLHWGNPFGPTFEGNWSREQVEDSAFKVERDGPTSGNSNRVTYTLLPAIP